MEVVETLLTPAEVAEKLRTTVGNLARKRSMNTGPPYIKVDGSVRYRWSDLSAWLDERTHKPEPSERRAGGGAR